MSFTPTERQAIDRYFEVGAHYADIGDLLLIREACFREIGREEERPEHNGGERYDQSVLWRMVNGVEAELHKRRLEAIKELPPMERLAALDIIEQDRIESLREVMSKTMQRVPE